MLHFSSSQNMLPPLQSYFIKMKSTKTFRCPDCRSEVAVSVLKDHVLECKSYKAVLLENTIKMSEHLNDDYLAFLTVQMQIASEQLKRKIVPEKEQMMRENEKQEIQDFQKLFAPKQSNGDYFSTSKKKQHRLPQQHHHNYDPTIRIDNQLLNGGFDVEAKKHNQSLGFGTVKGDDLVVCMNCHKEILAGDISKFVYTDPCCHLLCVNCMQSYIEDQYVAKKGALECLVKDCKDQLTVQLIRSVMDPKKFEQLQEQLFRKQIGKINIVKCFKCKSGFEFTEGNPRDAPKKDAEGKTVTKAAAQHYAKNRFLCTNNKCRQEQCRQCMSIPYHIGKTCEQNRQYKEAKKCRYCKKALKKNYTSRKGIKAFNDVCVSKQCEKIAKKACSKIHKCEHPCLGYIGQKQCLPCLNPECAKKVAMHDQNQQSFCSICYVDQLKSQPCIMSKCGHIFHYSCLQKRLNIRWLSPRIVFDFCKCPLCKQWIQVDSFFSIQKKMEDLKQLETTLKQKAMKRLEFQKLQEDPKLTDEKSEYYKKPVQYAMAIYAYFQCYKCKKPYFGGRKNCAEMMDNSDKPNSSDFDPSKLVCPECCPISTKNCEKHGKQFISFKCKFCCNIAQWFCWGSTHFCDKCHNRQAKGQYLSKMRKQKLPKCEGPQNCPIGGQHPPNGQQYNFCVLCRDYKKQRKDF